MEKQVETPDPNSAGNVPLSVPTREGMERAMANWDADTPFYEAEKRKRDQRTLDMLAMRGSYLYRRGQKMREIYA